MPKPMVSSKIYIRKGAGVVRLRPIAVDIAAILRRMVR